MIRGAFVVVMLCSFTGSATAEDFVLRGKPGKVDMGFIGCKNRDDFSKLKSLILAEDKEAAYKFAVSKIPDCRALTTGTIGIVEDNSVWTNGTCLRPKGEPDCYWLPAKFVVAP